MVTEQGAVRALGNQSTPLNRFISVRLRSYAIGLCSGFPGCSRITLGLLCGTNTFKESWSARRSHFLNTASDTDHRMFSEDERIPLSETILSMDIQGDPYQRRLWKITVNQTGYNVMRPPDMLKRTIRNREELRIFAEDLTASGQGVNGYGMPPDCYFPGNSRDKGIKLILRMDMERGLID